jgi:phosphate:Na+ symporter
LSLREVPLLGVLAGAILTGILQSSSALAGLVISMGMNDLVTLNAAIPILFGANIGTCITGLFASIGSSISSRRLALAQLMINVIGVSIFFPFLSDFAAFVGMTSSDLPRQIANAHSIFNVIVTALMLPLTPFLVTIVERLLPGEESRISRGTEFIDRRLLNTPSVALSQAEKEIVKMAKITYEMLDEATTAILSGSQKVIENILETESMVDELNETIDRFLDDIPSENLSEREVRRLAYLKHSITDIERVGDHANNLAELAERKLKEEVPFSIYATEELETMSEKAKLAYEKALTILGDGNKMLIQEVLALEDEIDALQRTFEANHVRRLENKICNPLLGIVFVDILRNLERIADHSTNIANATLLGF